MRIFSKNSSKVAIIGLVVALGAIPLYSYAIDYTSSGDKTQNDSGYTAGGSDFKKDNLYKGGLKKNIREPAANNAQNVTPPDVSGVTDAAIAHTNAVEEGTESSALAYQEEERCTDEDRAQALSIEKKFKDLDKIIEENKKIGAELNGMSENSMTQSKWNNFNRALENNAKKIDTANLAQYMKLSKNCDLPVPDSQILAPLRAAMTFGR